MIIFGIVVHIQNYLSEMQNQQMEILELPIGPRVWDKALLTYSKIEGFSVEILFEEIDNLLRSRLARGING